MDLREYVRDIPDFPQAGDHVPGHHAAAGRAEALDRAIAEMAAACADLGPIHFVVAAEARGFILGAALARELQAGFVPARKPGKLPAETVSAEYALEYGLDALEVHADAFADGARVLVHDDLLATGGTAGALCELVTGLGGQIVGGAFLVELAALGGGGAGRTPSRR